MNNRKIFTSESVTQGHPDKLCDLVSDSVLDAVLEQDPMGRVACETAATTGMVLVMGEITTSARIDTVVVSTQHADSIAIDDLRKAVIETVIEPNLPSRLLDENTKYYVNPTGRFVIGGPAGDSGLTGRKIIVDTYGGYAAHGGGAFSGKDPTKVDRSGAYMARYIAKNLVAAGLADACQLQLAYAIGVAHPVSVLVETYGTGKIADDKLAQLVRECFDLRPAAIIKTLDLRRPIYRQTAGYGHFGRAELDLPWEKTDMVQTLLAKA